MKNNRAFTLIELLAVIIIVGLLSSIIISSYREYLESSKTEAYKDILKTIEVAAASSIADCEKGTESSYCSNLTLPSTIGGTTEITLAQLISAGYMKKVMDPSNSKNACDSAVITVTNDSLADSKNISYSYEVCLICGSYSSSSCN